MGLIRESQLVKRVGSIVFFGPLYNESYAKVVAVGRLDRPGFAQDRETPCQCDRMCWQKNRPKRCPARFRPKLIRDFHGGKKVVQKYGLVP
jgi:hypothetical protein